MIDSSRKRSLREVIYYIPSTQAAVVRSRWNFGSYKATKSSRPSTSGTDASVPRPQKVPES